MANRTVLIELAPEVAAYLLKSCEDQINILSQVLEESRNEKMSVRVRELIDRARQVKDAVQTGIDRLAQPH